MVKIIDDDTLTPTEDLILDLVLARHRLGEPFWPIERKLKKQLDSLVAKGYVNVQNGPTGNTFNVSLQTDYRPSLLEEGEYKAPLLEQLKRDYISKEELHENYVPKSFLTGVPDAFTVKAKKSKKDKKNKKNKKNK